MMNRSFLISVSISLFAGFIGGAFAVVIFSPSGRGVLLSPGVSSSAPVSGRVGDLSAAPNKVAETSKIVMPPTMAEVCENDRLQFCADIPNGTPGLSGCLVLKANYLSAECKQAMAPQIEMRNKCQGDIEKFCREVPSGKGRVQKCLLSKKTQISVPCLKLIQTN